ncbi:hypothetical protein Pflav_063830 [Phytohabitans flavus]|uniref:Uncharacterized protein n=1 Tax=Phytohabitans flavus TaxID=1076124 RepID=A0A6F8Y1P2_9ACTN|nr:hypothetical protein Pflav_063830 [Phytohabitans flavus]
MGVTERVVTETRPTVNERHTRLDQLCVDVTGLGQSEALDPSVDGIGVDGDRLQTVRVDPELLGVAVARHNV